MADAKIYTTEKPNTLGGNWNSSFTTFVVPEAGLTMDNAGTYTITPFGKDEHTIIVVKGGSGAGTIELSAGNGYAGKALSLSIPATNYQFFTIDSSRYVNKETGNMTIKATGCTFMILSPRV